MRRSVVISPEARVDISRLVAFMSERDVRAADRVRAALGNALNSLDEFAEWGARSTLDGNLRELKVPFGRYGYFVQYRVRGDEVFVAGIRHAREDR